MLDFITNSKFIAVAAVLIFAVPVAIEAHELINDAASAIDTAVSLHQSD